MKKRNSSELNRKYVLTTITISLICVAVFSVAQAVIMDDIFFWAMKQKLINTTDKIEEVDFDRKGYDKLLSEIEANSNVYLEIYHPRDTLIYTTKDNNSLYEPSEDTDSKGHLTPRIMKILQRTENEDGSYFEIRQEYFASAQYLVYGCFFGDDMALEMYYSMDLIKENADISSRVIFYIGIIIMVLIIWLTVYVGVMVFMPLRGMITSTKRMANLDFSARCPQYRIRDLNELSASINTLGSSLSQALGKLQSENRKLEKDILYERRQDKSRRTFISNVSHELKTPIAIIKGYAEGMKMGIGCDSTEEFCDIIIDEADKMNNLIVRLMEYMKLNSGAYKLYSSAFNLKEAIDDFSDNLSMKIKEKNITYICNI